MNRAKVFGFIWTAAGVFKLLSTGDVMIGMTMVGFGLVFTELGKMQEKND